MLRGCWPTADARAREGVALVVLLGIHRDDWAPARWRDPSLRRRSCLLQRVRETGASGRELVGSPAVAARAWGGRIRKFGRVRDEWARARYWT